MADYVRKTMLSQGYAHIQDIKLSPEEKTKFEVDLKLYQGSRAKMMMSSSIIPEVKTKDGSLKIYATVYGTVSDAIGDISDGFMDALNNLYVSSKMLADACVVEGLFLSRAPRKNMKRSEARTGVIKTIKDLFDMTAGASIAFSDASERQINNILLSLEKKASFLNEQLIENKDKQLVFGQFLLSLDRLPKRPNSLNASQDETKLELYSDKLTSLKRMIDSFSKNKIT